MNSNEQVKGLMFVVLVLAVTLCGWAAIAEEALPADVPGD